MENDLTVGEVTYVKNWRTAGTVFEQSVDPWKQVPKYSEINFTVSGGPSYAGDGKSIPTENDMKWTPVETPVETPVTPPAADPVPEDTTNSDTTWEDNTGSDDSWNDSSYNEEDTSGSDDSSDNWWDDLFGSEEEDASDNWWDWIRP